MREAVIVIADLYLSPLELPEGTDEPRALAALEHAARFGEHSRLSGGWRPWLARWLGCPEVARLPVAQVAAASLGAAAAADRWIATPVELVAGLTRVHLDRRGIVRLTSAEQAELAAAFERTFGSPGLTLEPLGDGQLLLTAPGITPVDTTEPARCAGGELQVPRGAAAGPLLRLMAEIEMWLHTEPLNDARRARGAPPVTGLWLWGATGGGEYPGDLGTMRTATVAAFGSDAFLAGLCRLGGGVLRPLPPEPAAVFAEQPAERIVVVTEIASGEPPAEGPWSLSGAAAALERRCIAPALAALRAGMLGRLTLIANDVRVTLGRHSGLKLWRRPRPGLAAFA